MMAPEDEKCYPLGPMSESARELLGLPKTINTDEDCFVCGTQMVVLTKAPQQCPCVDSSPCASEHDAAWWAYDGDEVRCPECDAMGWVSVDEDEAYVVFDEMSEHNTECDRKYQESQEQGNVGQK